MLAVYVYVGALAHELPICASQVQASECVLSAI